MTKLAVFGGDKAVTLPMAKWPVYDNQEKAALNEALNARRWGTLGPNAMSFAEEFAEYCGVKHAISINNGTVGLEIILRGLEIGYGDEVIIPSNSIFSTLSAVASVGAAPVFADTDESFNIDPFDILEKITVRTRAVIAVHMGGYPCDMDGIKSICKKRGIYIIEDAHGAIGSEINNNKVGSLGDAASFDFFSSEDMVSGEGGSVTTDNFEIFKKLWERHNSGRTYDDSSEFGGTVMFGTNARMAEFQGAILRCQLKRIDSRIAKKNQNANRLTELLKQYEFLSLRKFDKRLTVNSYSNFIVKYLSSELNDIPRYKIVEALQAEGVPVSIPKSPLYRRDMLRFDYFKKTTGSAIDYSKIFLPNSEQFSEQALLISGSCFYNGLDYIEQIASAFDKISKNSKELLNR